MKNSNINITLNMSKSQRKVYQTIKRAKTSTRQSVAAALNIPINQVSGRVTELLNKGYIAETGYSYISERPRAILEAV
jgi:predicted transcriptional regulator